MTITVAPGNARNTHHVKLTRSGTSIGLILCNARAEPDESAIHMDPYPSQAIQMFTGEQKFTDKVPPYKPLAQMDWSGGMGSEYFEDDQTRFYHAFNANTTKRGKIMLGGLPTYATGYRGQDMFMPGNQVAVNTLYSWGALYGTTQMRAAKFTASSSYTANKIEVIIRRVGTPSEAATVCVLSNNAGIPGTLLFGGHITTSMVVDILSELMATDSLAGTMTITSGTVYWVVVYGGAGDTAANHWEIMTDGMADGKSSVMFGSWSTDAAPYFRVTDCVVPNADSPFIALFHEYKGQLYFASSPDNDSAGKLYMNGYRGVALDNASTMNQLRDMTQTTWSDATIKGGVASLYDGQGVTEDQPWRRVTGGSSGIAWIEPNWQIVHSGSGSDITQYNILGLNSFQLIQTGVYAFKDTAVTGEMGWICSGEDKQGRRKLYKYNEYTDGISWLKRWQAEGLVQASFMKARLDPVLGYILYLARNNDTDKDVCVARALAPSNFAQQLVVCNGYHSASPNGFMTEKQTTVTDTASDSFNRADGELAGSATDGNGHPGHTGGSGKTWTARVGDVHVISNKARPNSLAGGIATITYDCGAGILDVTHAASLYHVSGYDGIVVRFKDNDNYVYAWHTGVQVQLIKLVATVSTTLISVASTYVDGAEIRIRVAGTRFKLYYNNVYIGQALINDADLQTGTSCGLVLTSTADSIDNCWTTVADVVVDIMGTNQAHIEVGPDFVTGLLCTDTIGQEDWRRYTRILMAIKSTKAMASGELQLKIDDTALCASPIASVDFPLLLADYTYIDQLSSMTFDLSATAGADSIKSVGLYLTVNPTVQFDIDVSFWFVDTESKIIPIGDKSDKIKSLLMYGDPETPWVLKEGGLWEITNDTAHQVRVTGMEAIKSSDNGKAAVIHDVYLFFALGQSYERYFRQTVDDIGPNKDAGLPVLYQGNIVHAVDYPSGVICAVDGGDGGYSSVVFYNESGWHCIYRAPRMGLRIRRLHLQSIPGNPPAQRLWISQGADVLWIPISINPVNDSSYCFIWEGVVITSYFSSGMLDVNKFYKSLKLKAKNLSAAGCTILAQYRADESTTWISLPTAFDTSPGQEKDMTADYSLTGKQLQMRLILRTSDTTKSPTVLASVLNAFVIDPVKFTFTMNFRAADRDVDLNGDFDPIGAKAKIDQLNAWIADGKPLTMNSCSDLYDNKILFPLRQPVKPLEVVEEEGGREVHICQMTLLET
jgi:hypothetical protein